MIYLVIIASLIVYFSLIYLISKKHNRLDYVDVGWGPGFILISLISLIISHSRINIILLILVSLWGGRLAYYILKRFKLKGPDKRYLELSAKWQTNHFWLTAYFKLFLSQGLLILIISLPISLATGRSRLNTSFLIIGLIIFIVGYLIEILADKQLRAYLKMAPKNRPKVCNSGLWKYSRHPNYFGELTLWFGLATTIQGNQAFKLLAYCGPLVLSFVIIRISGIPPIENKRHNDPDYLAYAKKTNKLIPWFNKK